MTSDSAREIEAIDFQASLRPVHAECEEKARAHGERQGEERGKSESRSPAARPAWKLINCDFRLPVSIVYHVISCREAAPIAQRARGGGAGRDGTDWAVAAVDGTERNGTGRDGSQRRSEIGPMTLIKAFSRAATMS